MTNSSVMAMMSPTSSTTMSSPFLEAAAVAATAARLGMSVISSSFLPERANCSRSTARRGAKIRTGDDRDVENLDVVRLLHELADPEDREQAGCGGPVGVPVVDDPGGGLTEAGHVPRGHDLGPRRYHDPRHLRHQAHD